MKLSISLPDTDEKILDAAGPNRSATVHRALLLLHRSTLEEQYSQAFAEFADSGEQDTWDAATGDGIA